MKKINNIFIFFCAITFTLRFVNLQPMYKEKIPLLFHDNSNSNKKDELIKFIINYPEKVNATFCFISDQHSKKFIEEQIPFVIHQIMNTKKFYFDKWLKNFTNYDLRFLIIQELILYLRNFINTNNHSLIKKILKTQKEGLFKTALRFEYLWQKLNLIDSIQIWPIFYQLSDVENCGYIDLANLFQKDKTLRALLEVILELAPHFCKIPIKILYLDNNNIIKIPESIACFKKLEQLYLHNNNLKYFPCSISALRNLQKLCIDKTTYETCFNEKIGKSIFFPSNLKIYLYQSKPQ